ncbi:hypothetical protein EV1_014416 [Malus domestica]
MTGMKELFDKDLDAIFFHQPQPVPQLQLLSPSHILLLAQCLRDAFPSVTLLITTPNLPPLTRLFPVCGWDYVDSSSSTGINGPTHPSALTSIFRSWSVNPSWSSTCQNSTIGRRTSCWFWKPIPAWLDQLLMIDEQLVQLQNVVDKYLGANGDVGVMDDKDLDLLHSFKEQLQ